MARPARLFPALLIVLAGLPAAGCSENAPPAPQPSKAAEVAPEAKPGLTLSAGRLILPAVRGNPGVAYFTLANGDSQPATIAAVSIEGTGMAMLHETREVDGRATMSALKAPQVPAGGKLEFLPGGKHVMIDGLPDTLKPGASVEMTLTFADGDKLSAPLTVETRGGQN